MGQFKTGAERKAFMITGHKGVQIKFSNGFIISIQWGPGNYCDNHHLMDFNAPCKSEDWSSDEAEIAVIHPVTKELMPLGGDTVEGYLTVDQVFEWVDKVRALPPDAPEDALRTRLFDGEDDAA